MKTRKNLCYDFEVISCEIFSNAFTSNVKACIKKNEKTQNVEFSINSEEIVIGNEKKIYDEIDRVLKHEVAA